MSSQLSLYRKLVSGSTATRSRLHDQYGERVSLARLLRNGPPALATGIGRLAFGWRPAQPWISYDAQAMLARHLTPAARVLEFGSGMSTIWYARHAAEVVSIEDNQLWYDKVCGQIAATGLTNVRYEFAADAEQYGALGRRHAGAGFDLVMIDGSWRDQCVDVALEVVRPGGIIFLDNADKRESVTTISGNVPEARRKLLAFAQTSGAELRWYTDFAPSQFFVQTGLALFVPSHGR